MNTTIQIDKDLRPLFLEFHKSKLWSDGKTIADIYFKGNPEKVLKEYYHLKNRNEFNLQDFFNTYCEKPGASGKEYLSIPTEPVENHIEKLWDILTRTPQKETRYSTLIPLPYPYVVPGGRFNEIYYWDSYFTMLGLQVSNRTDLIESMVKNFAFLIQTYGFIPNGNRSYFLSRSQPPFFSLMIDLLAQEKGNDIYTRYLPTLEKEYSFWMKGQEKIVVENGKSIERVVLLNKSVFLNRYYDDCNTPRTEMYSEDNELSTQHSDKNFLLSDIRAACESGWDFSSRWCSIPYKLETIHTTDILPIDLNCLLFHLEKTLSKSYHLKGDIEKAQFYKFKFEKRKEHIITFFWSKEKNYFYDYDFKIGASTTSISLAGIFPLFFEIADLSQAKACAKVLKEKLLFEGGLATTTIETGQQWDAPNGWAPLQWIAIQGLINYGFTGLANTILDRWTNLNKKVFRNTGKLLEKYNVKDISLMSGGGEYPVQDGFGWTNGVLQKLIKMKHL